MLNETASMKPTDTPNPPRKTRIVATLGPSSDKIEKVRELVEAGVNIFRLNFSHATHAWATAAVETVRKVEQEVQRPIGILMDTQGPAIRTGELANPLKLTPGEVFTFTVRGEKTEESASVDVNYEKLVEDISVGDTVLVDNGVIRMKVLEKQRNKIRCEILTQGTLGSRRHINLPGVKVSLPSITEKDYADVKWGMEHGVDFVALSFVRSREDIEQLRGFLRAGKSPMRIIAKIEDQEAIRNLEAILEAADGVMVARGDLGIELPFEELPITQRKIVMACLRLGRPVIVATHLLESMHENPMPTRAEVTDVANAVYEQADAVMLSGETGVGRYPVKSVETMDTICRRIERSYSTISVPHKIEFTSDRHHLVNSAVSLANEIRASGIVVFTHAGKTAQLTSWLRPRPSHIYAFTPEDIVWRQMCLLWGVRAFKMKLNDDDTEATVRDAIQILKKHNFVQPGESLVLLSQIQAHGDRHDSVQVRRVV
jgi:pyruvate kinase